MPTVLLPPFILRHHAHSTEEIQLKLVVRISLPPIQPIQQRYPGAIRMPATDALRTLNPC